MTGPDWRFRPVRDSDYAVKSEIQARLHPDHPVSPEEFRQWDRVLEAPRIFRLHLAAEAPTDGSVVGFGSLFNSPWNFDPSKYSVDVAIDPRQQGRGLGRNLYETLETAARARGATVLWASVRAEDPRSCRFFERAGFVERRRSWASRLDLRDELSGAGAERSLPPGISVRTIAEEGAESTPVRDRLFRLRMTSGKDVPSMGTPTPYTLEQFLDVSFRHPGFLPEGNFVARLGDRYVATTSLEQVGGEPDTLHVGFTGTLREFRGRGLATELKRRAISFARSRGYRYLTTDNDSLNLPILKINQALGFRVLRTTIRGEKMLPK